MDFGVNQIGKIRDMDWLLNGQLVRVVANQQVDGEVKLLVKCIGKHPPLGFKDAFQISPVQFDPNFL